VITRPLALLCLLGAVPVAGCGGGGGGKTAAGGEAKVVASVVEKSALSRVPADCERTQTQRFMEQTQLDKGAAAIASCHKDATKPGQPTGADVTNVAVDGTAATARVAFKGGDNDGQVVNVSLVKRAGAWKLDHLDSFAHFDRARFLKSAPSALANGTSKEAASCLLGRLKGLSDSAIEQLVVSGDQVRVLTLFKPCVLAALEQELIKGGMTKSTAACVADAIAKKPPAQLTRLFNSKSPGSQLTPIVTRCLAAAGSGGGSGSGSVS
jgi:hypothetical protein